ncbi:MAG: hypothetical protein L0G99_09645 [Propionibacteriales bacterium]|nr:hypothetical protein [Propionibacteriales bacterium]
MLTEFVRDHAFTIAWFGLMAFVWFGWGQEDAPRSWRWRLGVGSVLGVILAGIFGYLVARHWADGSAMVGREALFGWLVGAELLLAGVGCFVLWRRRLNRWMAWWVGLVVAFHFIPLAFILDDLSLIGLGVLQAVGLVMLLPRLRNGDGPTSRLVGPVMGGTLLIFALVSVATFLIKTA